LIVARSLLLALAAATAGCHASNAAGAAVITSLAGGYSAIRRANGECYVDCLPGTSCNRTTGLCEPLACRGKCAEGLTCEETETGSACVPRATVSRGQVVESGARPFGDGQAAQGPHGSIGISSDGSASSGGVGDAGPALSTPANGAISTSPHAESTRGTPGADAGSGAAPANAVQGLGVQRATDPSVPSGPAAPGLDLMNNPWDRNHADPLPQMNNPNLPPPH
jgi:hypothetical protein